MKKTEQEKNFDLLSDFKLWMQSDFLDHCHKTYGEHLTRSVIYPLTETLLENLEVSIEHCGEEALHDDALLYDQLEGE